MFRQMLRAKIHRATVTDACLEYEGSLTVDETLCTISLNGPTARKGAVGDKIIIFCYEFYNEDEIKRHEPRIIKVDEKNRMVA